MACKKKVTSMWYRAQDTIHPSLLEQKPNETVLLAPRRPIKARQRKAGQAAATGSTRTTAHRSHCMGSMHGMALHTDAWSVLHAFDHCIWCFTHVYFAEISTGSQASVLCSVRVCFVLDPTNSHSQPSTRRDGCSPVAVAMRLCLVQWHGVAATCFVKVIEG
jgi:hypothetical protein